ncbi:MAG TPA: hypothetical protein VGP07_07415 [Polyangia bacterium]
MAVALQGLGMEYTHVRAESGESLWHVPMGTPNNVVLTLFVGPFTAGVTCVVGDVVGGQAKRPLELLRLNANLTLAKVALRDQHVFVQAEIPTDQVTDATLKLAITSVLDAVKRVKAICPLDVVYGSQA